jgi:hypothetical protein
MSSGSTSMSASDSRDFGRSHVRFFGAGRITLPPAEGVFPAESPEFEIKLKSQSSRLFLVRGFEPNTAALVVVLDVDRVGSRGPGVKGKAYYCNGASIQENRVWNCLTEIARFGLTTPTSAKCSAGSAHCRDRAPNGSLVPTECGRQLQAGIETGSEHDRTVSMPRAQSAANAPKTAIGEPSRTLKGSVQLTQSAAIRKTKSSGPKTTAGETPSCAFFSWNAISMHRSASSC